MTEILIYDERNEKSNMVCSENALRKDICLFGNLNCSDFPNCGFRIGNTIRRKREKEKRTW